MNKIYLIKKYWFDSLTSMREPDEGYSIIGAVLDENIAKIMIAEAGTRPAPYPRYDNKPRPILKYEEIPIFLDGKEINV